MEATDTRNFIAACRLPTVLWKVVIHVLQDSPINKGEITKKVPK